jgi:putative oxidoreductase
MQNGNYQSRQPRPWVRWTFLMLRLLLAATFVAAGSAKLTGAPAMVQIFDAVGIGQWFRILTGVVEISGAILLIVPATVGFGGALMATTMAGAVATHLLRIGGNPAPAIILLLLCSLVLWVRRGNVSAAFAKARNSVA